MNSQSMSQNHKSTFAISLRVIIAAMGNIYFGYALGYYGTIQDSIIQMLGYQDDKNKVILNGLINSLLPIGGAVGSLLSCIVLFLRQARLVQKFGTRKSLIICDAFGIIIVITSLYLDWWSVLLKRFLFGVIVGINSALDPQYIQQISPKSLIGILGVVCNTFIFLGLIIAFVFSWIFVVDQPQSYNKDMNYGILGFNSWRVLFAFPSITCLIRLIAFKFYYTYDLPSDLLRKGQQNQSKLSLMEIYQDEYIEEIFMELEEDDQLKGAKVITFNQLFGGVYKKRMIVGCVLSLLYQWSGINAVSFYSHIIFNDITNEDLFWINALSVISQVLGMLVSLASGFVINKFGRRKLFLTGNGICCLTLTIFTFLYYVLQQYQKQLTDQYISLLQILIVISIFTFIMAHSMSLGPVFWIYIPEILPSSGIGIVLVLNWMSLAFMTQIFPIISEKAGTAVCFGMFVIVTLLGEIFIYFQVLETKNQTKTEIHNMYLAISDSMVTDIDETNDLAKNLKSVNEG